MEFGVCIPHYGSNTTAAGIRTTVELAESLGYHSVWVSDHVVTPEHLLPAIGPVFYDAFVVLSYAAAFTTKVRLGSSVIVVPYRNPLVVAKMLATLDVLSGGRVIFGAGVGGAPDEFQALGVPSRQRGRRADECLKLMVALWTQDPASFHGRFYSFTDVRFQPKPLQVPYPPIWIGGRSEAALRRAVAVGEAWHPTAMPMPALREKMAQLRGFADEAGRAEGPLVTIHQGIHLNHAPELQPPQERRMGRGTTREIREDMAAYAELGIPVVVCNFAEPSLQDLCRAMEGFAAEVMPYFP